MKAAIIEQIGAPLEVREIEHVFSVNVPLPGVLKFGQVKVRMLVAGICGAQLQEIDGHKGDPSHLPHLLGHEGVGIVECIGPGVTTVKSGDKVVLHWRKGAGCDVGGPVFSRQDSPDFHETQKSESESCKSSKSCLVKSGPITTFSEFTIISENRCTAIPSDVPNDFACLLGCSLSTALGIIENDARVKFGESVLVVGCGGLGLSIILAAKLAHAFPIIATDIHDSKAPLAEQFRATFCPAKMRNEKFAICNSFDVIIDTTGTVPYLEHLKPDGRYIIVGQSYSGTIAVKNFAHSAITVKATQGGCFSPETDIPRYVNLWRSGAFETIVEEPYESPGIDESYKHLITHRVPLDRINDGIDLVRSGKAGRVLIDFVPQS